MNKFKWTLFYIFFLSSISICGGSKKTGIYSSMKYYPDTGDIGGMEIFVTYCSGGINGSYYVLFQKAEGAPSTPQLVEANIWADSISFTIPQYGLFKGKISQKELRGKFDSFKEIEILKRKKSYWQ